MAGTPGHGAFHLFSLSLFIANGGTTGIYVPVPCPGCECRGFNAGLVSEGTEWIKEGERLKAGRTPEHAGFAAATQKMFMDRAVWLW